MSEIPTLVTVDHFRYLSERTTQEDEFLRELKLEAASAGLPRIWVAQEQASLIQILLKLCRAREVVEIGTLAGYSSIWMARALPEGGRLTTIEVSSKHADFAERWISRSDVAGRITIRRGAAKDIMPKLKADSADAAFLDADPPNYPVYLQQCLRIVRRGGLIMMDNAFGYGRLLDPHAKDREVSAVRAFNDIMAKAPGLTGVIVPLGDGLWVAVKE